MKQKICKMENIGLDAITMFVSIKQKIKFNDEKKEIRNKDGGIIIQAEEVKNGYKIVMVLPRFVRPSNIYGLNTDDNIEQVKKEIEKAIREIFGNVDLRLFSVRSIECNANKEISSKVDTYMIIGLLARALLQSYKLISHLDSKRIYETEIIKNPVISGFKTDRDTTARFYIKIYDKGKQLKSDKKILRLELIYTARGIEQALGIRKNITLLDVLQVENMQKIIDKYIDDVRKTVRRNLREYLDGTVNIIKNDLKVGYKAYEILLKHYSLCKYDYRIFCVALKKYYKEKGMDSKAYSTQVRRIRKRALLGNVKINKGTIKELERFFKEIDAQKSISC